MVEKNLLPLLWGENAEKWDCAVAGVRKLGVFQSSDRLLPLMDFRCIRLRVSHFYVKGKAGVCWIIRPQYKMSDRSVSSRGYGNWGTFSIEEQE